MKGIKKSYEKYFKDNSIPLVYAGYNSDKGNNYIKKMNFFMMNQAKKKKV